MPIAVLFYGLSCRPRSGYYSCLFCLRLYNQFESVLIIFTPLFKHRSCMIVRRCCINVDAPRTKFFLQADINLLVRLARCGIDLSPPRSTCSGDLERLLRPRGQGLPVRLSDSAMTIATFGRIRGNRKEDGQAAPTPWTPSLPRPTTKN